MTSWNPGGTPDPSGEQPPQYGQQPPPPPGYQPPPPPGYGQPPAGYPQAPQYGQPPQYGAPPAYPGGPNQMMGAPAIGQPAQPSKRFLAWLTDVGIFIIPAIICSVIAQWLGYVFELAVFVYFVWAVGSSGQTFGMKIIGTKAVDSQSGQLIGYGRAFVRQFLMGICFIVALSVFWAKPPLRQSWHDMAANSIVIRTK
jgi:uncharacterized RDD family membrane protein YckC